MIQTKLNNHHVVTNQTNNTLIYLHHINIYKIDIDAQFHPNDMIKKFSPWSVTKRFLFETNRKAIHFSNVNLNGEQNGQQKRPPPSPPPADLCCRSGCAKCVWLEYCLELVEFYRNDGGVEKAQKELENHVHDPSLRMFIMMELKQMLNNR